MKNSKITTKLVALILMGSLFASVTSCAQQEETEERTTTTTTTEETTEEETETTEETSEETSEETTAETTEETTEETEPEIDLGGNNDRQACSDEEDDARYMAFFQNELPAYCDRCWIPMDEHLKVAYVDLDGDGADELLVGASSEYGAGVYCVVTEVNGEYHRTDVYGWALQQGALTGEYLGNGLFYGEIGNGNNYESESQIYTIFQYDGGMQDCGILVRYSEIFHFDETVTEQLYTLNEGSPMIHDIDEYAPGNTSYTYESGNHVLGESPEDNLMERYFQLVESYSTCEDPYSVLSWRPITDIIG